VCSSDLLDEKFNKLVIFMDPARPHMYMPIGARYLRLEFRVMENETDESVTDPAVAWEFLTRKHGLGPDDVRIMRQVVYHYHTRIAETWRDRRVLIAGDAAHTMPPYMGQGGCAAVRDGRNLGWKLIEVLTGRSDPAVLDSYQIEREPHVTTLVMASDMLSRTVNIVDPVAAAARDKGMRETGERTPPPLPSLTAGVLRRNADGALAKAAGQMTPQGMLRRAVEWRRGDDLLGTSFQLWCRKDPIDQLGEREAAWLEARGAAIAVFDDKSSPDYAEDRDGDYLDYLKQHDADFVLVRPDFYAFGAGALSELNDFIRDVAGQLRSELPAGSPVSV
jgi:3-(3-hydroxy-phenyl)propionate hydroxylase